MEFIQNNKLLIITISLFIMFAILGYIIDKSKNKNNKEKEILTEVDDSNNNNINNNNNNFAPVDDNVINEDVINEEIK